MNELLSGLNLCSFPNIFTIFTSQFGHHVLDSEKQNIGYMALVTCFN